MAAGAGLPGARAPDERLPDERLLDEGVLDEGLRDEDGVRAALRRTPGVFARFVGIPRRTSQAISRPAAWGASRSNASAKSLGLNGFCRNAVPGGSAPAGKTSRSR